MTKPESALIAVVPEAEPLVASFRQRFDPSAAAGVPAHITVLYPFRDSNMLDDEVIESLRRCFRLHSPIAFQLTDLRRFNNAGLYLAPDPSEPFRQLTLAVWRLFPENPPYSGKWPDIVPHLSVAYSEQDKELDNLAVDIGRKLKHHLPVKATTLEVLLIENRGGRWARRETFRLGN